MALTGHQEAHELLLIEEADAWFEYLEATRGAVGAPVRRGRALGVGASRRSGCVRSAPAAAKLRPAVEAA